MSTTIPIEEHNDDLWGELEGEFESAGTSPIKINTATPIQRRTRLGERLRLAVFSGFFPMLTLCVLSTLVALSSPYKPLSAGIAGLFAFLLAGLLAPVFGSGRRALWVYALPALLVGLIAELSTTTAEMIERSISNYSLAGPLPYLNILQDHLERYLSFEHWALYLVAAPAIAWLTFQAESQSPWLDAPKRSGLRKALALLVLVTPAITLLLGLTLAPRLTADTDRWLASVVAAHPQAEYRSEEPENRRHPSAWSKLGQEWHTLVPFDSADERIEQTPAAAVVDIEKKVSALLRASGPDPDRLDYGTRRQKSDLESLLLLRHEDLAHPVETTRLILEDCIKNRLSVYYDARQTTMTALDTLLGQLAGPALDQATLESMNGLMKAKQTTLLPTLDELDIAAAKNVVMRADYSGPRSGKQSRPLEVFGTQLRSSPTGVFIALERAKLLAPWLAYRPILAEVPEPGQYMALQYYMGANDRRDLYDLFADVVYSELIRPHLQAGELLSALRLHKIRTGSWPTALDQVSASLSFRPDPAQWSLVSGKSGLKLSSATLKAQHNLRQARLSEVARSARLAATEWVLR